MKKIKTLTALILLLTLTLTSCSSLMEDLAKDPEDTPSPPVHSGGEAEPSEPDAAGMPEGFTVFPEGNYLPKEFRTSDPLPGFDYVDTFHGSSIGGTPTSCSTETTYYYFGESREMLCYMDKATGISGPLCGKPECFHTDSTCNGYIGGRGYGLSLYDGRLWWITVGFGAKVHSCALDGTDHREELKISKELVGRDGVPDVYFHRGVMYWVETGTDIVGGVRESHSEIIAIPLDGGEPYFIYRADPIVGKGFPQVFLIRDKMLLIFDMTEINYNEDHSIADWHPAIDIYLFDLNTRQLETLFSGETDFMTGTNRAILREDGIYITHGNIIDENGGWVGCSRFLPWEGGSFEPLEYHSWDGWAYDGRFIVLSLGSENGGGKLSVTERSMEGALILDRSFPVRYTGNPILLLIEGWDEDFYYFQLPSVRIAVATDGSALYYLAGTETTE